MHCIGRQQQQQKGRQMAEQVHMTINNNEALEVRLAVAEDTVDNLRHEISKLKIEVNTLERALKIVSRGEDSRW